MIGVCSYGGLDFLKLSIQAAHETTDGKYDIFVVVGKPGDDETCQWLEDEQWGYITHRRNEGFPAAINDIFETGFVDMGFDNVILMGSDVIPYPRAIDVMVECADSTDWEWICSSQFDAKSLCAMYPEARQYFQGENLIFTDFNARPWELHKHSGSGIEPNALKDVQNLCLYKRSAFEKLGYVDVNFWPGGYFSDNDYARRGVNLGVKGCGLPESAYFHFWSRTIHQGEHTTTHERFARNEAFYKRKWGGPFAAETFHTPFNMGNSTLREGLHLPRTLKVESRDQEADIINYWSSL